MQHDPSDALAYDPLLHGASAETGLVALDYLPAASKDPDGPDAVRLYWRSAAGLTTTEEAFRPFLLMTREVAALFTEEDDAEIESLEGPLPLDRLVSFPNWARCTEARKRITSATGYKPSSPNAPFFYMNDPVQQYLVATGRTHFMGLPFEGLVRLQLDIECRTTPGYDFCNAAREGDTIIAIGMSDSTGWTATLSLRDMDEAAMLKAFVACIRERDPDVIEGHNIFNFDLPYIKARCKQHKVKLALGRDGSVPKARTSRLSMAERQIAYTRFDLAGRHVVDTMFLVQAYDISHRSLSGYGLKQAAIHFGFASAERTYIPGHEISAAFESDPDRVLRYLADDVSETKALASLLSRSFFAQAQLLPFSYQNICVRGNATKIDALMIREYLRRRAAIAIPSPSRPFAGGYTDCFETGVIRNVHHCDIRSLYPTLMLTRQLAPVSDTEGVFLRMLDSLREFRLEAKQAMQQAEDEGTRNHYDALQSTFKVLINSFYGYLGFSQGHFCDFDRAEEIAAGGRELLSFMIDWLRQREALPVEIDTDGIYFVPPDTLDGDAAAQAAFEAAFAAALPEGLEIEFDGQYESMYSYKMKNYALLEKDGEMIIKGAALKSRGLEPFQRELLQGLIRLKLEGREQASDALRRDVEGAITGRRWPITKLAKSEQLSDSPAAYATKRSNGKTPKRAAYELALSADRDYRAGDQISYYVTGNKKSVTINENCRLVADFDPDSRDENIAFYLGKLATLYKKFGPAEKAPEASGQLGLGF
jgi:DNA polymerase I